MIFSLVQDFTDVLAAMPAGHPRRRIVKLLDEAIRRDVHFIDRHPTTLFQCLWNSCWWYDCQQAENYYQEPASEVPFPGVLSNLPEPRLSSLVSAWRQQKERDIPFRWLRALRPPQVRLDAGQQYVLRGHEDYLADVAYSADGRFLATCSRDGTIRIWDAVSFAELICVPVHQYGVEAIAFSPDEQWLACGGSAGELCVLDTANGSLISRLAGHKKTISQVCFSPDGQAIATVSWDGTACLWNASNGIEIARFTPSLNGFVREARLHCGCFSPNGKRLAVGSNTGELFVWDVKTAAEVLRIKAHDSAVEDFCYTADGSRMASASSDLTIRVWDADTGGELCKIGGHTDKVYSVAFSPDGQRLASASADGTIRVMDSSSGQLQLQLHGHTYWVTRVRFSSDGQQLASASWDKTARVWNANTSTKAAQLRGHQHLVGSLCFSPDGRYLASESGKSVQLWKLADECEPGWSRELPANIGRLYFSNDAKLLACGVADGSVRLLDVVTGAECGTVHGLDGVVRKMSFSPTGQHLAIAALMSKTVLLWDLTAEPSAKNTAVRSLREPWLADSDFCFSNDGLYVISSSDQGICVSNARNGKLVRRFAEKLAVRNLCISPDGRRVAGSCAHEVSYFDFRDKVHVWDLEAGTELLEIEEFKEKQNVRGLVFSLDGQRLAGAIESSNVKMMNEKYGFFVRVWDVATGECLESFEEIIEPDLYSFANGPAAVPCRPFRSVAGTVLEENGTRRAVAFFPDAPARDRSGQYRASPTAAQWAWSMDNYIHVIALEGDLPQVEQELSAGAEAALQASHELNSAVAAAAPPAIASRDDQTLISQVTAMLKQGEYQQAAHLLRAEGRLNAKLMNALGVCYLRLGQANHAAAILQSLVNHCGQQKNNVPTIYATNLATAFMLQGNFSGAERLLDKIDDKSHPAVKRLKQALLRRNGFLGIRGQLYRLFGQDVPLKLDFTPGDFR